MKTKKEAKAYWKGLAEIKKPSHTPTPWKLDNDAVKSNGKIIGWVNSFDECEGDRAFICKAVNEHEALIDALKGILNSTDCNLDEQSDETSRAMKKAYAVLVLAEKP